MTLSDHHDRLMLAFIKSHRDGVTRWRLYKRFEHIKNTKRWLDKNLKRLEKERYIKARIEYGQKGPRATVYYITPMGDSRLKELDKSVSRRR